MDRKRLSPWLRKKVNAGEFGLGWINEEEQCFSIPWRHKSNKAWNKDKCQIFKEWAKFTNKHQEGQPEDWPGWKQRLRSALNKLCDFEEMHQMHNLEDLSNPYKVYKFVAAEKLKKDPDSSSSAGGSPYSQPSPGSSQASPYFDALHLGVDSNSQNYNACCWGSNAPNIPTTVEHSEENVSPCDSQVCLNIPVSSMFNESIGSTQHQIISSSSFPQQQIIDCGERSMDIPSLPSDLLSLDSNNLVSGAKLPSDEYSLYRSDAGDMQLQDDDLQNTMQQPKIRYKIYFLDEVLAEGTLGDNEGAHFYFGQLPESNLPDTVFGPKGLKKIKFPDVTNIKKSINSEMTRHIQDILMKMDRGFLLQYYNGDIYVQRLCRTRIFAYNPQIGNRLLDRSRKEAEKLFEFSAFKESLTQNPDAFPPPETVLTFGQELKNWDTSFRKLYVHVELSHIEAWELQERFFPSSSKYSILYSDLDSEDWLLQSLKNLNLNNKS